MESLGVLVMSCDKNLWLLDIFFDCFYSAGGENFKNVYLSLEKADYQYKNEVIKVIKCDEEGQWSQRLRKALSYMKEDYVLLLLDDFIIEEPLNIQLLKEYIRYLKNDLLNNIILTPVKKEKNEENSQYSRLEHRSRYGRYKTSLQCSLWQKIVLYNLSNENESAWEFEIFSNIRAFLYPNKFYAVKTYKDKPIIYNDGLFMVQGKINLDEKNRLEKKLEIRINSKNIPGFYEKDMVRDNIDFWPRVVRRIKIIFYYWIYRIRYICGDRKKLCNV